jgi:hypothetical protein
MGVGLPDALLGGLVAGLAGGFLGQIPTTCRWGKASSVAKRSAQEVLHVPVSATEFILRPTLDSLQDGRVDAKQKWFSCHVEAR